MQIFLDEIVSRYPNDRIVMVLDNAGWHRSKSLVVPENMKLLYLPAYSPELNPVENIWEEIREKNFDNIVFADMDVLGEQLLHAMKHLENHPELSQSISAWPWIINSLPI